MNTHLNAAFPVSDLTAIIIVVIAIQVSHSSSLEAWLKETGSINQTD